MAKNDKHTDNVSEILKYSLEQFDKSVMFIASGALGVSFAFIKDIVPNLENAGYKRNLIASWYLFSGAIFLSLVCHFVSMKAHLWAFKNINLSDADFNKKIRKWNNPITYMNVFMIIFTFLGCILLITFVNDNISNS